MRKSTGPKPTCKALLRLMASRGNAANVAGMKHFGIEAARAVGLSAPLLHRMAREIGRDHELALELWASGVHEARHLAALIDQPEAVTPAQMERWAKNFSSWDIVDSCCRYLFLYTPFAWKKAVEWSLRREEFVKRAGFSQMAYLAVHDKQAPDAKFLRLFPRIRRGATDQRNFVRKAVNWALRQIGKRNLHLNRRAIQLAEEIRGLESPAARWIAADALRELRSIAVQRRLRTRPARKARVAPTRKARS